MKKVARIITYSLLPITCSLLLLAGCQYFPSISKPPVKAAIYMGDGALGVGEYHWLQIVTFAKGMETTLVDAKAIREGALDGKDLLIMPGGRSWDISAALGTEGAKRVKRFIRKGGGYIGTCAGAFLVSESSESHPKMLDLLPFTSRGGMGRADMVVRFNSRAEQLAGIRKGTQRIAYAGGPIFVPTTPVPDAEVEIIATYDSNINTWTDKPLPSMAGQAAVIAGHVGKGRVFVSTVHPEADLDDHYIIAGALRFVTGRDITWEIPQRTRGQLAVGVDMEKGFRTVEAAEAMRAQLLKRDFDFIPVNADILGGGMTHHLDAVIKPDDAGFARLAPLKELPANAFGHIVDKPWDRKKIQVAVYTDKGGANYSISDRLELSPEFEVTFLSGADIAKGALKGKDMLLQPGGWSPSQYEALGTNGCAAIKKFVREGGSYYGLCAGAFLASETISTNKMRASMMPWKDIGEPTYRGWGPIKVRITDEGFKHFGNAHTNRYVTYWGGPVFEPGAPIEGADIKSWGDYFGYNLCTSSPKNVMPMTGHAAFLGGTIGKGKVFISGPHPEKDDRTYDMVYSAIEYLTGVRPNPVSRDRRRGALSVAMSDMREKAYAKVFLKNLIRDRRFDVRVKWDVSTLKHLDVVVLGAPKKDNLTEALRHFAENGGTVIAVADTPARQEALKGVDWVTRLASPEEIPAALGALCPCPCRKARLVAESVSPDGQNTVRLYVNPLSYEVLRNGRPVVLRTPIDLEIGGRGLAEAASAEDPRVTPRSFSGMTPADTYKKAFVSLEGNETFADFGDWGVRLAARNDGVAWRFETKFPNEITVTHERAGMAIPSDAECFAAYTNGYGKEQRHPESLEASELHAFDPKRANFIYMPFVFRTGDTVVGVSESDLYDYPVWNVARRSPKGERGPVVLESVFARWPTSVVNNAGTRRAEDAKRQRHWLVRARDNYLTRGPGKRTFPWRCYILADEYASLCESDIVYALARKNDDLFMDFSWVRPGKVAWEWWNAFDNIGDPAQKGATNGCTTATYRRFIDFAAKNKIEYVIMDEGWSQKLNIWEFAPEVDVPALIDYANEKGVGIILWMAWAQVDGDEERVAEHFAKLGVKGFKVDFMDRGDAQVERFLWKFADACARHKLLVDWHGAHRPTGQHRAYPNVINYEAVHGLEVMKFYNGKEDFMDNDVKSFFVRMTAGPMDYTPGAMLNYPKGSKGPADFTCPGSFGTRCHQIALMSMFEAPLQMLCDSPTHYEQNQECLDFMAETPVVWEDVKGLGGTPDTYAAVARKAKDGTWWVSAITNWEPRDLALQTSFLGAGEFDVEIFRDAPDCATEPTHYVHEAFPLEGGEPLRISLAPGGGAALRITRRK